MDYFFATVPATVPIFRNRSQNNLQFFFAAFIDNVYLYRHIY